MIKCYHCLREFPNISSKNVHLRFCKKRVLTRYLKVKDILFIINWNPKYKVYKAIRGFLQQYKDIKYITSILIYEKMRGEIVDFNYFKVTSPKLLDRPDGWLGIGRLQSYLIPDEYITIFGVPK